MQKQEGISEIAIDKDSEETVILQNLEEKVESKQELCLDTPLSYANIMPKDAEIPWKITEHEIVIISSDSEKDFEAEQKSDKELWKFRNPKKKLQI